MRVAVVGGGLGGLCLAQGLRKAKIDVTVYERDATLDARRQGYRLHVDSRAGLALRECLPPDLFELFVATCGRPGRRFTVMSERLRVLHETPTGPDVDRFAAATLSTSVNRRTLREILAAGLDDHLEFDRELTGYETDGDGVRLRFADGSSADADVLVGADGVNSPVRRRLLPQAEVVDTGTRCVYGRTPLTDAVRGRMPAPLGDGFTAFVGGAVGMAAGLVEFRERPEVAAARIVPGVRLSPAGDYLMWAVTTHRDRLPDDAATDAAGWHAAAAGLIRSWHPDLRELVAAADVEETFPVRIRTSVPVAAWAPSRVTLLGDAIHAMSPARGSGANTALKDAARLCDALVGADEPVAAIGAYEAEMRDYGFAAVEASRAAEAEMGGRRGGLMFWLYRRLARRS